MISHEHEQQFEGTLTYLRDELSRMRANRAHASLVEHISVSAYGSMMPLVQLSSLSTPDAKTIVIQPWDKSLVAEIEKAIQKSDVGIQPTVAGDTLRLNLPPLTEERRKEIVKMVREKGEAAKIRIRTIREQILKAWKTQQRDGVISEDDLKQWQKQLQEKIDMLNNQIADIIEKKEKDIVSL